MKPTVYINQDTDKRKYGHSGFNLFCKLVFRKSEIDYRNFRTNRGHFEVYVGMLEIEWVGSRLCVVREKGFLIVRS